jgi:hypothetical protein
MAPQKRQLLRAPQSQLPISRCWLVSPSAPPLSAPAARQPLGSGGVIDEQKHPFTFNNHRNAACPFADVRYRGWGVSLAVVARRMRDQSVRQDQRAHLMDSHIKPINELVERLRDPDSRRWAPYVAPMHGGTNARILSVLRDVGPKTQRSSSPLTCPLVGVAGSPRPNLIPEPMVACEIRGPQRLTTRMDALNDN